MKQKFSRRNFIEVSLKGSILTGGCSLVGILSGAPKIPTPTEESNISSLDGKQEDTLRAAMDAIIPAEDGMPSASAAGGVDYLKQLSQSDSLIKRKLERSLNALNEISLKSFRSEFSSLRKGQRVESLKQLERQPTPELFTELRDYVYEAYYTQPQVWELIGYEFYPNNHRGPHMNPFDETVLSRVRKMGKLYREVS